MVRTSSQRASLHFQVDFRVAVGGLERDVPEPSPDRVDVHARTQEVNGGGVPQGVWADALSPQGGRRRYRSPDTTFDQRMDAVAGDSLAAAVEEHGCRDGTGEARSEQSPQGRGGPGPERADSGFASLPVQADGRRPGEVEVGDSCVRSLAGPGSGVVQEQEQRVVALPLGVAAVGRFEQGFDLRLVQVGRDRDPDSTERDPPDPCGLLDQFRCLAPDEAEQRVEGGKALVASRWRIPASLFEVSRNSRSRESSTCSTVTQVGSVAWCSARN